MTIRWFTDADRQDMRDAREERQFLEELDLAQVRDRSPATTPVTEAQLRIMNTLQIDPSRRPGK